MYLGKIIPKTLQTGDEVVIISPSYFIEEDKIEGAIRVLEGWGLRVRVGKNALKRYGPFAGTDEERLSDLQAAVDDRKIKAVFCARGGYGLLRIIDKAHFRSLRKSPKWFIGYSDVTVLHMWLNEVCGIASLHAEMPLHYMHGGKSIETFSTLQQALFEGRLSWRWEGESIRGNHSEGVLTGGNLSLLYSLMGTKGEPITKNRILFIEDEGEYYYSVDRMLTSLKLAGKLKDLAGLVIGGFSGMQDGKVPWGRSVEETVFDIVKDYNYPVFARCPAGHINDNRALILGSYAVLEKKGNEIVLIFR